MYFLRWIAGYPILIILLVTALYALYNKDSLKHWFNDNDVVEEVSHQTTDVKEEVTHAVGQTAAYPAAAETQSQAGEDSSTSVMAEAGAVERSGSWLDRFTHRNPAPEVTVEHTVTEAEVVATEPVVVAEESSGSWLDRFTHRNPVATVEHATTDEHTTAKAETVVTETVEVAEEKSGSWLDAFKREKPEMEVPAEVVAEKAEETIETEDQGSWLDVFKNKNAKADHEVEADSSIAAESVVEPSNTVVTAEAEKESGSWLDAFKREKAESDSEVSVSESGVAETAAVDSTESTEVAVATEEKESGSWLDIFKRKSKTAESAPEAAKAETSSTDESAAPTAAADHGLQRSESLRLAREAYWNRDYDAATAIYENMSKAEPNNLDILGEYGNFLLQVGRMNQALDVYEEIAIALVRENRHMEVHPLLRFIGNQDPDRADALSRKLHESQQTNN